MAATTKTAKVSFDLFRLQLTWTLWFFGITAAVFMIFGIAGQAVMGDSALTDFKEFSFFYFLQNPAKIYMLVIGITSISSFLPFYIRTGITRRDYFIGSAFTGLALSVCLTLLALLVTTVLPLIQTLVPFSFALDIASGLSPQTSYVSSMLVSIITLFIFYIAGWLIGVGFYKYHWIIGLLFIAIAFLYVSASEVLLDANLSPLTSLFANIPIDITLSLPISLLVLVILSISILWAIRRMIRQISIKIH